MLERSDDLLKQIAVCRIALLGGEIHDEFFKELNQSGAVAHSLLEKSFQDSHEHGALRGERIV